MRRFVSSIFPFLCAVIALADGTCYGICLQNMYYAANPFCIGISAHPWYMGICIYQVDYFLETFSFFSEKGGVIERTTKPPLY